MRTLMLAAFVALFTANTAFPRCAGHAKPMRQLQRRLRREGRGKENLWCGEGKSPRKK